MSWQEHIDAMRLHVNREVEKNPISPMAFRRCPECGTEVHLVTGQRSGISWFHHPDRDCINEHWKRRIHFQSREKAMQSEKIFREVQIGYPIEPDPPAPQYAI